MVQLLAVVALHLLACRYLCVIVFLALSAEMTSVSTKGPNKKGSILSNKTILNMKNMLRV